MAMQDRTNNTFAVDAMAGVAITTTGYNSVTFVFSNAAEAEVKLQHSADGTTYTDVTGRDIVVPNKVTSMTVAPGVEIPTGDTSGLITYDANTAASGYNRLGYIGGHKYVKLVTTGTLATAVCVLSDSMFRPVGYSA